MASINSHLFSNGSFHNSTYAWTNRDSCNVNTANWPYFGLFIYIALCMLYHSSVLQHPCFVSPSPSDIRGVDSIFDLFSLCVCKALQGYLCEYH